MDMMKFVRISLVAVVAFVAAGVAASADDAFTYSGYFRSGFALTGAGDGYKGYGIDGCNMALGERMGRLGNEGDRTYLETGLNRLWSADSGAWAKATVLLAFGGYLNGNYTTITPALRQCFAEVGGFGFAPDASFWAGHRYYGREDIHIIDHYYRDFSGTGFGITNIAKVFDIAYTQNVIQDSGVKSATGVYNNDSVFKKVVATGHMGAFKANLCYGFTGKEKIAAGTAKNISGIFADFSYDPTKFFFVTDGSSKIVVQYANGAFVNPPSWGGIADCGVAFPAQASSPSLTRKTPEANFFRGIAHGVSTIGDQLSIGAVFEVAYTDYQKDASGADVKTSNLTHSFAVRPMFQVTSGIELQLEAGYCAFTNSGDGAGAEKDKMMLQYKVTPSVAFAMDSNFYTRPQIRVFASYMGQNSNAKTKYAWGGSMDKKSSIVVYGAQAEAWW
jgi:maltoporin